MSIQIIMQSIVVAFFSCTISFLVTYFFMSKGREKLMSEVISTMEKKICKHEETCGKDMLVTIRNFDLKLQKIELRQVKMDVKMNMTASLVSKIADKMKITIDLKDINNNSEED